MFELYPDVLTVKDLMTALQISRTVAYRLLQTKEIKSIRCGKNYKIPKKFLIDYCVGK